ncbi:MAG: HAMP domain-containing histidine kinase [Deltaproteobacteria bacterium]|nr:HAMP domain-containing histidine kinase [Deltaproteobacteria bacterium]
MRLRIILLFLLTVLVPTLLLGYFSLLAVKGEHEVIEINLNQKYRAIVGIVLGEIETGLEQIPEKSRLDPKVVEPILRDRTRLFQDEAVIFRPDGRSIDGFKRIEEFNDPVYRAPVGRLPYEIAVFERTPLLAQVAAIRKKAAGHVKTVSLFAVAILCGGLLTLSQLLREWKKTEMKAEFISQLAHDLRGPLTSLRMFSEMLQTGRVTTDEKKKEYYQILSYESEKLTQLAFNILDFSRMERGKKKYEKVPDDISHLVRETIRRFERFCPPGEIANRISLKIDDSIRPFPIDSGAISQALLNILYNARKYSPPGSEIRIVVSKEGDKVGISVIDQGIGIPKEEQKMIFRPYYRGKSPEAKNREGEGLGLAIVSHAVLAHRGDLTVKSEEGRGSEFRITLPLPRS